MMAEALSIQPQWDNRRPRVEAQITNGQLLVTKGVQPGELGNLVVGNDKEQGICIPCVKIPYMVKPQEKTGRCQSWPQPLEEWEQRKKRKRGIAPFLSSSARTPWLLSHSRFPSTWIDKEGCFLAYYSAHFACENCLYYVTG